MKTSKALTGSFDSNAIYELAGDLHTYADLAEALSTVLGKEVQARGLSSQEYRQALAQAGLPEPVQAIVAGIQDDIANHQLEVEHSDLDRLLGHAPLSLVEAVEEMI
ncbi:hypothetical protein [Streptococcus loxodontisalivarius]|uniref:Uncharacterized protein YbjT (DUF2867 family) n=1 Tax=Streptococcus loxodontisalivarius TaxID=1349415 RepID=A0ABS2PUG8_9STRE|nr:hypothetical protein [Streptococcus loxodontisalivarius]MBM7643655.1 uncharacterized protein YbjT (DUF2867 family) [Streptococcus loxodontisalivarius]